MSHLRYVMATLTRAENQVKTAIDESKSLASSLTCLALTTIKRSEIETKVSLLEKKIASVDKAMIAFTTTADSAELDNETSDTVDKRITEATELLDKANEVKDVLSTKLDLLGSSRETTTTAPISPREAPRSGLPTIPIPTFFGAKREWSNFWTLFKTMIHESTISRTLKFNYLLQCLKGEAKELIQRFDVSEENYDLAIRLLENRYDNKESTVAEITKKMQEEKSRSNNLHDQQRLFDHIFVYVTQLQNLGEDLENRLIKETIIRKFDEKIQRKVYTKKTELRETETWTINKILGQIEEILDKEKEIEDLMGNREGTINTAARWKRTNRDESHSARWAERESPKVFADKGSTRPNHGTTRGRCNLCSKEGHFANECSTYPTVAERKAFLKTRSNQCWICFGMHPTNDCKSTRRCFRCDGRHNTAICEKSTGLHEVRRGAEPQRSHGAPKGSRTDGKRATWSHNATAVDSRDERTSPANDRMLNAQEATVIPSKRGYLPIAKARIFNNEDDCWQNVSIMFDTGSDNSYITKNVAERFKLKSKGQTILHLMTFGSTEPKRQTFNTVKVSIRTRGGTKSISALVSDPLVGLVARAKVTNEDIEFLVDQDINADCFENEVEPDMIIGCNFMGDFWTGSPKQLPSGLMAIDTEFGIVTMGRPTDGQSTNPLRKNLHSSHSFGIRSCETKGHDIQWDSETTAEKEVLLTSEFTGALQEEKSKTNEQVWAQFKETIEKRDDGYYVRLPWKEDHGDLLDNYAIAYRRLQSVLKGNKMDILQQIDKVFKDQVENEIIEEVDSRARATGLIHYNPHQPVITPHKTTTKCRVVIDGSSHFRNERSLNDTLHQGPVILPELVQLLIRFRTGKTAITADVEKAFLQVHLHENDRDATRVLWVRDIKGPPEKDNLVIYRFRRVLFGLNSSPFLLGATIHYHLTGKDTPFSNEIRDNIYVDNVLLTTDEVDARKLKAIYDESKKVFREMNMNLREYRSNEDKFNSVVDEKDRATDTILKILGIVWNSEDDHLLASCNIKPQKMWTKRAISSSLGAVYDPLGLLVPLLLPMKLFLRKLWEKEYEWDKVLDDQLIEEWEHIIEAADRFETNVARNVIEKTKENAIVTFTDASAQATACCVYVTNEGKSNLIYAKSRVKPIMQKWTIPKLELQALHMGMLATHTVIKALSAGGTKTRKVTILSDSEIALSWIKSPPGRKEAGIYVSNRLRDIRKITADLEKDDFEVEFGYVNTIENPADDGTRGLTKDKLLDSRWWIGPNFLLKPHPEWPSETRLFRLTDPEGEHRDHVNLVVQQPPTDIQGLFDCTRTNSFLKMKRIVAYALRYLRTTSRALPESTRTRVLKSISDPGPIELAQELSADELKAAEIAIIKDQQRFLDGKKLKELKSLNVNQDEAGILRCHGRMQKTDVEDDVKKPILILKERPIAKLIIIDYHGKWHCPTSQTISEIRKKFWIPKLRQSVKTHIGKCVPCQRFNKSPFRYPDMEDLPKQRVQRSRPFQFVGLDYFGPITTKTSVGNEEKAYGCIITCQSTRLTYLDVAKDMTTKSFLNVLRRFFALRGVPELIVPDNAPTFLLGNEILKGSRTNEQEVNHFLTNREIRWKLNTPFAPWQGGLYERLIRNVKEAMYKSIGRKILTLDELTTALMEIAQTMNHRPLTYTEANIDEITPIRPIDFIQNEWKINTAVANLAKKETPGDDEYLPPEERVKLRTRIETKKALQSSIEMTNKFWDVWYEKYLSELREQHKLRMNSQRYSKDFPEKGKIVLVCDPNQPKHQWEMASIENIVQSKSGEIREIELRTANRRSIKRSPNLIIPLEIEVDPTDPEPTPEIEREKEQEPNPRYNLRRRRREPKYVETDEEALVPDPPARTKRKSTKAKSVASFATSTLLSLAMVIMCCGNVQAMLQCTETGVKLNMEYTRMEVCAKNYCTTREKTSSGNETVDIWLPPAVKLHEHSVTIKQITNDGPQITELLCDAIPFCKTITCTWCLANIANPECYPTGAIFVSSVLLYIALTIIYFFFSVPITLGAPFMLLLRILSIIGGRTIREGKRLGSNCWRCVRYCVQRVRGIRVRRRQLYDLAILAMIIHGVRGCQEIDILEERTRVCTEGNDKVENCRIRTTEVMSMSYLNKEACLRFTRNGTTFKELRLVWKAISLTCRKQTVTHTRNVELRTKSVKRCPHMGSCHHHTTTPSHEKAKTTRPFPETEPRGARRR